MAQDGEAPIDPTAGRKKWITPAIRARRGQQAAPYASGLDLEALIETGRIAASPYGERVMTRAILADDGSELALDSYRMEDAIAHEVIALSPGAERWMDAHGVPDDARDSRSLPRRLRTWWLGRGVTAGARPRPGDHVFIVSAACERVTSRDNSIRLCTVHVEDVATGWQITTG